MELARPEYEALLQEEPLSVREQDQRAWLRKRSCGSCFFLDEGEAGGRCELHRRRGPQAKPTACLEFPFRAVETPGGVFVGASFACQAIAQRQGPPLTEVRVRTLTLPETPLAPGAPMDWERYLRWEARIGELLRQTGGTGLWTAALELSLEVLDLPPRSPSPAIEGDLQAAFRGLLALAEGPMDQPTLLAFLRAHTEQTVYPSRILGCPVDVAEVLGRYEEPWSLWPQVQPFFEHLLFRKYLLEGPDVHARICSLPILAQILQFLMLAKRPGAPPSPNDVGWALRVLEERLTFHARGLERYLGRCGGAFLNGLNG